MDFVAALNNYRGGDQTVNRGSYFALLRISFSCLNNTAYYASNVDVRADINSCVFVL